MRLRLPLTALALFCVIAASAASDAQTAGSDPAARGLDLFLHAPHEAAPGARLPLQIEALGFPTVVTLTPLSGAKIEAAWDPESLGRGVSAAPPSIRAVTDASGRVHLDVPVPDGDERDLTLLVGVRHGSHERTRTLTISRRPFERVALHVADDRVVPGSQISTWVTVSSAATGEPLGKTPVEISLLEGGFARHRVLVVTDAAGTAMTRVPIPRTDEPAWSWRLQARTLSTRATSAQASRTLSPRQETPGSPRMWASWDRSDVLAGDRASFTVRVRDAADLPIVALPVRYWVGPRGTEPPAKEEDWIKGSTLAQTDATGSFTGQADAPSTVVQGVGTTLRLVVKTKVEGHDLKQESHLQVGAPAASADLSPEAGSIVPGLEQRMLLSVRDGHWDPISARFAVTGDGLKAEVKTDDHGEAEVTWRAPVDLGAMRNVGPCAGGVAAAVTVRPLDEVKALATRGEPFELCVPIDRDARGLIALDRPVARVGDKVRVRVLDPLAGRNGPKPAWSVVMHAASGEQAASVWIDDGDKGGEITVPASAGGAFTLSAAPAGAMSKARASAGGEGDAGAGVVKGTILVTPKILPRLTAKVSGGRPAPGGSIEVDADLRDEQGKGLTGTVAAVVIDAFGGGSVSGLVALDTRGSICRRFGIDDDRCDRFVEGDPALDARRRSALANAGPSALAPENDPAATARAELIKSFGEVLRSLEGAVFEASVSPDRLRDVRRKGAGGWVFNPELMTLVTAAMDDAPETPGGEKLALGDLMAVDPQVSFDNVARRITRLKLFRILSEVRNFRHERSLDPDEPIFKNPNALLRKLVRDGRLGEDILLDPWGGTIQFAPSSGAPVPFLSVLRGFELRAPGPDGRVGTGDDVRDPFERVLRSGTPYAKAVSEDRIVDAKFDLEVGDATVSAWESMFNELTGTALGSGGLGMSGFGAGGSGMGSGFGSGHGGLAGRGRASAGISTGVAYWSPPRRTDAQGHVHFTVPLGDAETTWRIALVGVPDGAQPATTSVDVPVALPLSARVDAGASWVEGDALSAEVTLRNRTAKPIRATLEASAGGVAKLAKAGEATQVVEVPAGGAATARVGLLAPSPGEASLSVRVRAPGLSEDVLQHRWQVLEAGEPTDLTRAQWVDTEMGDKDGRHEEGVGRATLSVPFDAKGMRLRGKPRLVLERGFAEALRAALEALDPDRMYSPEALGNSIEVAGRIKRWAIGREGEESATAKRADEVVRRAKGRLDVYEAGLSKASWATAMRVLAWAPSDKPITQAARVANSQERCPASDLTVLDEKVEGLDAEPAPVAGANLSCWDAFVSSVMGDVQTSPDPVLVARALLALSERPHRSAMASLLADRLRSMVNLRSSGGISLPGYAAGDRSSRALVFAALLRSVALGSKPSLASAERLSAWIAVQRDADGGYGSPGATRSVVRALLESGLEEKGATVVTLNDGEGERRFEVGASGRVVIPLSGRATSVALAMRGPGVLARLERPVLRLWSKPPVDANGPMHVEVEWPKEAKAGKTGVLRMYVRHGLGRSAQLDARVPLPPGVSLAEQTAGVMQVQGVLRVRRPLDASNLPTMVEIPLRFALSGRVTAPEVLARVAFEEAPRTVVPARPFIIH